MGVGGSHRPLCFLYSKVLAFRRKAGVQTHPVPKGFKYCEQFLSGNNGSTLNIQGPRYQAVGNLAGFNEVPSQTHFIKQGSSLNQVHGQALWIPGPCELIEASVASLVHLLKTLRLVQAIRPFQCQFSFPTPSALI